MATDVLTETGVALVDPLVKIWQSTIDVLPGLVAAIIVLIVGYIIAVIIGGIVKRACVKLNLDKWALAKTNLQKMTGKFSLSAFFGIIVKWLVFVAFWPQAAALIKLPSLSGMLTRVAAWVPDLIWAIVIAMGGFIGAEYVAKQVTETKTLGASVIATVLKAVIIIVTAMVALRQIGIDIGVAENSFLIILAGIMLAVGLGFGLALKGEATSIIKAVKKRL